MAKDQLQDQSPNVPEAVAAPATTPDQGTAEASEAQPRDPETGQFVSAEEHAKLVQAHTRACQERADYRRRAEALEQQVRAAYTGQNSGTDQGGYQGMDPEAVYQLGALGARDQLFLDRVPDAAAHMDELYGWRDQHGGTLEDAYNAQFAPTLIAQKDRELSEARRELERMRKSGQVPPAASGGGVGAETPEPAPIKGEADAIKRGAAWLLSRKKNVDL